jgi:hypothetical protein
LATFLIEGVQMTDPVLNDIGMKLFKTPAGLEYFAWEKASLADELAMEEYNDLVGAEPFPIDEDEYEDPDSDGYGWERRALRSAWM